MTDMRSPLAAIIHEDRELTDPLPSALSREAERSFENLAENWYE